MKSDKEVKISATHKLEEEWLISPKRVPSNHLERDQELSVKKWTYS